MLARRELGADAERLIAAQDGVISCSQALALGTSRKTIDRLIRDQRWTCTERGIFVAAPADPAGLRQRAWTGHLLGGDLSAIGGEASLALKGARPEPPEIAVVVPAAVRHTLPSGYRLLRDAAGRLDHRRGTLACIRPEDAILDVAPDLTLEQFVGLVTDVIRTNLTTAKRLESVLRERARMRNRREYLDTLGDLQGIESNLEFVFRRDVERAHNLPRGERQVRGRGARFDVWYEEFRVVAEVDGKRGHIEGRFRDYTRDNEQTVDGKSTFRYGGFNIRGDACGVADQLGRAFIVRGWSGAPSYCPHCRPSWSWLAS